MPVLIVAIASFLVFVAIVVLLLIAATLESRAIRHKRNVTLANPLALLSISEAFDPIYSILWEAPVAALTRWLRLEAKSRRPLRSTWDCVRTIARVQAAALSSAPRRSFPLSSVISSLGHLTEI